MQNSWEMLNSSRSSWIQLFHSPMLTQNFQSLEIFYSFLFRIQNIKCNCQAMQISFHSTVLFVMHWIRMYGCVFSFLAYRNLLVTCQAIRQTRCTASVFILNACINNPKVFEKCFTFTLTNKSTRALLLCSL